MQMPFFCVIVFGVLYCAVKFPIISFVLIIRIIRNVIVSWIYYVLLSETITVRLFQRNKDCYCGYYLIIIVLN